MTVLTYAPAMLRQHPILCPRCSGAMEKPRDEDGDLACIVCGHRKYVYLPAPDPPHRIRRPTRSQGIVI